MAYSRGFDLPWLEVGEERDGWLHLAGYGPSLADTWKHIDGPCMTMSGAHDYLLDRGIKPAWHTDMDPRPHKVQMVTPTHGVQYLLAGVCHPTIWGRFSGYDVRRFHVISAKSTPAWMQRNEKPGAVLIGGGSEIGLAALHVAGTIGWRRFVIHGFDHSLRAGERHAGKHGGPRQRTILWKVGGRVFETTRIMVNAAFECVEAFRSFGISVSLRGDGLLQEMMRSSSMGEMVKEAA